MGATLPAVARWVETTPQGVSWLGFFYGGNIAGAVVGSLLAGFYLLRMYDTSIATYVAVALNVAVALGGLAGARMMPAVLPTEGAADVVAVDPGGEATGPATTRRTGGAWAIYLAIAISGMTALAAEVIWTRTL